MAIADLGGDATLLTPSADVAGVLSHGILQIISDPRSTVPQMLQALLAAELADNDGWTLLQQLLESAERSDLADMCESAVEKEAEHLEKVRSWLKEIMLSGLHGGNGEVPAEAEALIESNDGDRVIDQDADDNEMDALDLLKADHEEVKQLFEDMEQANPKEQKRLFKQLKKALETHTRIEESIFYPTMQQQEELVDLVLESLEEHKQVKTLLREIDKLRGDSEKFEPKLKLLKENVAHHAEEEEEGKMFPKIRELLSQDDLLELGEELRAARNKKRRKN